MSIIRAKLQLRTRALCQLVQMEFPLAPSDPILCEMYLAESKLVALIAATWEMTIPQVVSLAIDTYWSDVEECGSIARWKREHGLDQFPP